ncbi:MAG: ABC transporter ATP-binding protein [Synergistaceae bacterium]|jgi:branched-chain amino acid transport system ATP-binding protein|nr:ABC transporter ATP-binding protein [Synergistaceae bacterium]
MTDERCGERNLESRTEGRPAGEQGPAHLEVRGLHVHYGSIHALHGVDLAVGRGEIVCVVGVNGAGKSTLMWAVSGVLPVTEGSVLLDGVPLVRSGTGRSYGPPRALPPHEIVNLGISLVPERRRLFSALTVRENLIMGSIRRTDRDGIAADLERCFSLYPVLKERLAQRAGTLSGGEQQMLAVSRALMSRPSVLLLDEPSLGLAPLVADALFDTILKIREEGVTVLLVEQNALQALSVSDRGYVLQTGEIVTSAPSGELIENPLIRKAYLGS